MVITAPAEISRRQFLAAGGLTVAAACLVPRGLCAQKDDLVEHALKKPPQRRSRFKTFAATSAFFMVRAEMLPFSPVLTDELGRACE